MEKIPGGADPDRRTDHIAVAANESNSGAQELVPREPAQRETFLGALESMRRDRCRKEDAEFSPFQHRSPRAVINSRYYRYRSMIGLFGSTDDNG